MIKPWVCPKCDRPTMTVQSTKTFLHRKNVTRKCDICGIVTINGIKERYDIDDFEKWYNSGYKILTNTWNKLPRWGQSALIIGIWIFIMGSFIYQTVTNPLEYRTIPLATCAVLFSILGGFYIVMELKGELRKK